MTVIHAQRSRLVYTARNAAEFIYCDSCTRRYSYISSTKPISQRYRRTINHVGWWPPTVAEVLQLVARQFLQSLAVQADMLLYISILMMTSKVSRL
jgi:hypothetical protein